MVPNACDSLLTIFLYYRASEALALLDSAASEAGRDSPQGPLRLTAPIWCATATPVFARWMGEYRDRYPAVSLDIILDNDMCDLIGEGIDLALRDSKTPAPTLVISPLFTVQFVLVASPAYLR
ncbi:LysR substrate-binding domain-containing protein [Cardiobacterium valvarum]|nr:LysR substrate-binding domain-containing protein [Cardiobacterium valvarum]